MTSALRSVVYGSLLVVASTSLCQESNVPAGQANLYGRALFAGIAEMDKEWGHINTTPDDSIRTDYHHMIVKRSEMTEGIPGRSGDYQAEFLDARELVARYRKMGKRFAILVLHPIKNDGPTLAVNIGVFWFSHKKTASSYAFSDWSDVEFRYDCEKRDWVIAKVKLGGI